MLFGHGVVVDDLVSAIDFSWLPVARHRSAQSFLSDPEQGLLFLRVYSQSSGVFLDFCLSRLVGWVQLLFQYFKLLFYLGDFILFRLFQKRQFFNHANFSVLLDFFLTQLAHTLLPAALKYFSTVVFSRLFGGRIFRSTIVQQTSQAALAYRALVIRQTICRCCGRKLGLRTGLFF